MLKVDLNGQPFGRADAGEDMTFDFGTLVAHLAKTRNLGAGTIIGSGTVSNRDADGGPGKPVDRGGTGYSCLAEVRTVETILDGKPATPFLKAGDTVRIWMEDAARPLDLRRDRAGGRRRLSGHVSDAGSTGLPGQLATCRCGLRARCWLAAIAPGRPWPQISRRLSRMRTSEP